MIYRYGGGLTHKTGCRVFGLSGPDVSSKFFPKQITQQAIAGLSSPMSGVLKFSKIRW
jgi:hypothetical protein